MDDPFRLGVLRTARPDAARTLDDAASLAPGARAVGWLVPAPDGPGRAPVQLASVLAATRSDGLYDRYLTSSVPLVAGASGAPLLDAEGRLLGMAVGCATNGEPGSSGANAANGAQAHRAGADATTLFVRGEDVVGAADEIARTGRVRRARLGVLLDGDTTRVDQLLPGSPAERAGLREGDILRKIAGVPVSSAGEVTKLLLRRAPGETVQVDLDRAGETVSQPIRLEDVPIPLPPLTAPLPGGTLEIVLGAPDTGVVLREMEPGGQLEKAGAQIGDVVRKIDGVDTVRYCARHQVRAAAQTPATIEIERAGERRTLTLPRRCE
jgi:S1-C subfamily serine protease